MTHHVQNTTSLCWQIPRNMVGQKIWVWYCRVTIISCGLGSLGLKTFFLSSLQNPGNPFCSGFPMHGSFWWWSPGFTSDPPVETTWVVLLALPALDLVSGHGSAWAILNFLSCSMTRPSLSLAALDTPEDTQLLESGEHVLTPLNSSMSVGTPLDLGVNFGSWACQD